MIFKDIHVQLLWFKMACSQIINVEESLIGLSQVAGDFS